MALVSMMGASSSPVSALTLIDIKLLLEHPFLLADGRDREQLLGSLASTLCPR